MPHSTTALSPKQTLEIRKLSFQAQHLIPKLETACNACIAKARYLSLELEAHQSQLADADQSLANWLVTLKELTKVLSMRYAPVIQKASNKLVFLSKMEEDNLANTLELDKYIQDTQLCIPELELLERNLTTSKEQSNQLFQQVLDELPTESSTNANLLFQSLAHYEKCTQDANRFQIEYMRLRHEAGEIKVQLQVLRNKPRVAAEVSQLDQNIAVAQKLELELDRKLQAFLNTPRRKSSVAGLISSAHNKHGSLCGKMLRERQSDLTSLRLGLAVAQSHQLGDLVTDGLDELSQLGGKLKALSLTRSTIDELHEKAVHDLLPAAIDHQRIEEKTPPHQTHLPDLKALSQVFALAEAQYRAEHTLNQTLLTHNKTDRSLGALKVQAEQSGITAKLTLGTISSEQSDRRNTLRKVCSDLLTLNTQLCRNELTNHEKNDERLSTLRESIYSNKLNARQLASVEAELDKKCSELARSYKNLQEKCKKAHVLFEKTADVLAEPIKETVQTSKAVIDGQVRNSLGFITFNSEFEAVDIDIKHAIHLLESAPISITPPLQDKISNHLASCKKSQVNLSQLKEVQYNGHPLIDQSEILNSQYLELAQYSKSRKILQMEKMDYKGMQQSLSNALGEVRLELKALSLTAKDQVAVSQKLFKKVVAQITKKQKENAIRNEQRAREQFGYSERDKQNQRLSKQLAQNKPASKRNKKSGLALNKNSKQTLIAQPNQPASPTQKNRPQVNSLFAQNIENHLGWAEWDCEKLLESKNESIRAQASFALTEISDMRSKLDRLLYGLFSPQAQGGSAFNGQNPREVMLKAEVDSLESYIEELQANQDSAVDSNTSRPSQSASTAPRPPQQPSFNQPIEPTRTELTGPPPIAEQRQNSPLMAMQTQPEMAVQQSRLTLNETDSRYQLINRRMNDLIAQHISLKKELDDIKASPNSPAWVQLRPAINELLALEKEFSYRESHYITNEWGQLNRVSFSEALRFLKWQSIQPHFDQASAAQYLLNANTRLDQLVVGINHCEQRTNQVRALMPTLDHSVKSV